MQKYHKNNAFRLVKCTKKSYNKGMGLLLIKNKVWRPRFYQKSFFLSNDLY